MSLKIGSALGAGIGRVANRNGAKIGLAYLVLGLIWQVTFYSAIVAWARETNGPVSDVALPSIDAPVAVSVAAGIVSLVLLQYLTIIAVRTFVGGHSRSIPREYFTRNILFVVANAILGGIAFSVIVFAGSLLFLVPGVVAYVAFSFFLLYLGVEDVNFVTALRDSWGLTRGHWLRLFVLLAILVIGIGVISGILSLLTTVVFTIIGGEALASLASGLIALPFSLITLGVLAEAFDQLREGEPKTATL